MRRQNIRNPSVIHLVSLFVEIVLDVYVLFLVFSAAAADDDDDASATVEDDIGKSRDASRTDDEVVERYGICSHGIHFASAMLLKIGGQKFLECICSPENHTMCTEGEI